jgi:hypothetical protein
MDDEDTIELVLTPEQMAALTRAAVQSAPAARPVAAQSAPRARLTDVVQGAPPARPVPAEQSGRPARSVAAAPALVLIPPRQRPAPVRSRPFERQLRAIRVPAFVSVAVFAISLGSIKYVAMSREQEAPLAPAPLAAVPAPPAPTSEAPAPTPAENPPPVQFTNPFDRSEIFDFPPGTTREEARAAVAEMLMERARTRVASHH